MKKLVAILSLLLLVSCGDTVEKELKQTRDDQAFSVEMVIISKDITTFCTNLGVQYEANGCSAFYPDQKKCIIYVQPQRFMHDKDRLEIIGHELWHCRYGSWHD